LNASLSDLPLKPTPNWIAKYKILYATLDKSYLEPFEVHRELKKLLAIWRRGISDQNNVYYPILRGFDKKNSDLLHNTVGMGGGCVNFSLNMVPYVAKYRL
jgi:hypothetical protein